MMNISGGLDVSIFPDKSTPELLILIKSKIKAGSLFGVG